MKKEYTVQKCSAPFEVDANWDKPFWQGIESLPVGLPHWPIQNEHIPQTEVKLQYDPGNRYVIFQVQDKYVPAAATDIHGEVWKDSCVEFFFALYAGPCGSYLNLEVIAEKKNVVDEHLDIANKIEAIMAQARTRPEVERFRFGKYECFV